PRNILVNGESVTIERASKVSSSPSQSTLLIADARYAAPELIMARSAPDHAAHVCGDIYVLGFLFYELLRGKKEMRREVPQLEQPQAGLDWLRWHGDMKSKVRPLSEVSPGCPENVCELIERMLEKIPSRRVRTLEDVAGILARMNARLATTQTFVVDRPAAPDKRKRVPVFKALTAAGLLSLAAGSWWIGSGRSRMLSGPVPGQFS